MNHLATAERLFNRAFSSEASRQEHIGKLARSIEQSITTRLLTDDAEATEIAGDMLGWMESETMMQIIRCALRGDAKSILAMRMRVLSEMSEQVKRTAEDRAIKQVEATTPADFLP